MLAAGFTISAAVAQNTPYQSQGSDTSIHPQNAHVMMQNGKVMLNKNGTISVLRQNLTLPNGTVISKDGAVRTMDGTVIQLKEGEQLDMEGKPYSSKDQWQKETKDSI